jgi:hypothetical protein
VRLAVRVLQHSARHRAESGEWPEAHRSMRAGESLAVLERNAEIREKQSSLSA